ncbi:hypothetical protein GCM10009000_097840 [Halobacterium noricense]
MAFFWSTKEDDYWLSQLGFSSWLPGYLKQRESPAVYGGDETRCVSFAHQNAPRSGDGRESRHSTTRTTGYSPAGVSKSSAAWINIPRHVSPYSFFTRFNRSYCSSSGTSTVQQIERKNREAWQSFFALREKGEANGKPGFWGNQDEGRELRTYIRNTSYSVEWGEHSRLEILVGQDLKEEYGLGYRERLRLEVRGEPNWKEYDKQGRLELYYDDVSETFRAFQPVTIDNSRLAQPLADESAALDIGANNIVACTTTTGEQHLYEGRDLFERFRETTQRIAELQSKLEDGRYSSKRIDSLYRRQTRRRDHAMDALCRDLVERLHDEGVSTVYVGDLTDVPETHWSVRTNAKLHNFWAFRRFIDRLVYTAEEFGITVEVRTEAWTSQTCPNCSSTEDTTRHQDTLTCTCGFEGPRTSPRARRS